MMYGDRNECLYQDIMVLRKC